MHDDDVCPRCGADWEVIDNYHFSRYHWQEHMLCRSCGWEELQDFTVRRMFYDGERYRYVRNNTKPPAMTAEDQEDTYAENKTEE